MGLQRKLPSRPIGSPDDRITTGIQDAVDELRDGLNAIPFIGKGRMVTANFVAGATVQVPHQLGHKPEGWLACKATGSAPALFEVSSDTKYITITHSGAGDTTVQLWVY